MANNNTSQVFLPSVVIGCYLPKRSIVTTPSIEVHTTLRLPAGDTWLTRHDEIRCIHISLPSSLVTAYMIPLSVGMNTTPLLSGITAGAMS